jgi:hypothetical protein
VEWDGRCRVRGQSPLNLSDLSFDLPMNFKEQEHGPFSKEILDSIPTWRGRHRARGGDESVVIHREIVDFLCFLSMVHWEISHAIHM